MFENLFTLFFFAAEELCELPLGKHGHAVELGERKSHDLLYNAVAVIDLYPVGVAYFYRPLGGAVASGTFHSQVKAGIIINPVIAFETHHAVAIVMGRYAETGVLFNAFDANSFFRIFEHLVFVVGGIDNGVETGSGLVEGEGDAVEQCRFAYTGVAADKEYRSLTACLPID